MYMCVQCGAEFQKHCNFCVCCDGFNTIVSKPNATKTYIDTRERQLLTARQLARKTFKAQEIKGFEALGKLPSNWHIVCYGSPGAGKSTFAIRFGARLSELCKVLYIASEEGQSATLSRKLQEWEIYSDSLIISDAQNENELRKDIDLCEPDVLIMDSVTDLNLVFPFTRALYVAQVTKSNSFAGRMTLVHDADIVIRIENRQAIVEKNRFNDCQTFDL